MENSYGTDLERSISKEHGWVKFKKHYQTKNPAIIIDRVDDKQSIRKEPIISYGIIEFVATSTHVYYHVFRRRHTLEYDILFRGTFSKSQLYVLLSLLSRDERDRLRNLSVEKLWDDYWIDHEHGPMRDKTRKSIEEAKEVLNSIDVDIPCKIIERPFIFPKGKPHPHETGLQTALREATEETKSNFSINDSSSGRLYFNSPIIQNYIGSDDNPYSDYYYVWQRRELYASKVVELKDQTRERKTTISHELEADAWIEIPIFDTRKEFLEWQQLTNSYEEFRVFTRHFHAILQIHDHFIS